MSTTYSADPIATVEQFKKALLSVRDSSLPQAHLSMLQAQCQTHDHSITATKLAEAAGYENFNAANLQYGTLASKVAKHIGFTPELRKDGSPHWWTTLSYANIGITDPDSGHFLFIMRPELVQALKEMKWVKTPTADFS